VNYGVPNDGIHAVVARLRAYRRRVPLGVNLVETNRGEQRSASEVVDEIRRAAELAAPLADYLTINVQCPNSAQGPLAQPGNMQALLRELESMAGVPPVFLKTPATTDPATIDRLLAVAADSRIVRGIVPVVVLREPFPAPARPGDGAAVGSITGTPTREHALRSLRAWYRRMEGQHLVLVGGGGVATGADAYAFLQHGASLVQIATALVYHGPGVVREINRGLLREMARDGVGSVRDVVGSAAG
jgi:dihydroorotate dehydrogenase